MAPRVLDTLRARLHGALGSTLGAALGRRPSLPGALAREQARRAALMVAVLVVLALPPVFVNHPIGYLPLLTYVFLLVLCWAYVRIIKRGFSVESAFGSTSCVRGATVDLPIVVKNRSRLPVVRARPKVSVANPYGQTEYEAYALCMIGPMGDDSLNAKTRLGHVGTYTVGLEGVALYDPLMFFCSYVEMGGRARVFSTPQQHGMGTLVVSDMALNTSPTPTRTVLSDDVDYAGTRDYEYGDPMKSVHWKLSARTQNLQTRLFEESVNTRLSVVMDFHAPAYSTEELMSCNDVIVEVALAVMRMAQERRLEARLRYVDRNNMPVARDLPAEGEMEQFVGSLPALSEHVAQREALGFVERGSVSADGGDNVVFCTCDLTRELARAAVELSSRHLGVTVVLAMPHDRIRAFYRDNRGLATELELAGVACVVLSDPSDLEAGEAHA